MIMATSVVATIERWRRVMRRHAYAQVVAVLATAAFATAVVDAVLAELAGDPWPVPAVAVVCALLAAAVLAGVVTISIPSAARAVMDASHVNRNATERTWEAVKRLRSDMQQRTDLLYQLAAWMERMDMDLATSDGRRRREVREIVETLEGMTGQIERAREQGRAEAAQTSRIREAHIRDEHRAELEQVAREARRAGYERGVEVGRARRIEEEEQADAEADAGLTPDVLAAFYRVHHRLTDDG